MYLAYMHIGAFSRTVVWKKQMISESYYVTLIDMRRHYENCSTSKSLGVCIIAFLLIDRRHYQYSIHFLASVYYHKPKNWIDDCFPMTFSNHLQRCFALHIEITQLIERLGL